MRGRGWVLAVLAAAVLGCVLAAVTGCARGGGERPVGQRQAPRSAEESRVLEVVRAAPSPRTGRGEASPGAGATGSADGTGEGVWFTLGQVMAMEPRTIRLVGADVSGTPGATGTPGTTATPGAREYHGPSVATIAGEARVRGLQYDVVGSDGTATVGSDEASAIIVIVEHDGALTLMSPFRPTGRWIEGVSRIVAHGDRTLRVSDERGSEVRVTLGEIRQAEEASVAVRSPRGTFELTGAALPQVLARAGMRPAGPVVVVGGDGRQLMATPETLPGLVIAENSGRIQVGSAALPEVQWVFDTQRVVVQRPGGATEGIPPPSGSSTPASPTTP